LAFAARGLWLLWSLAEIAFDQYKTKKTSRHAVLDNNGRRFDQRLTAYVIPTLSAKTNILAITGFALGLIGGIFFLLAPGGVSPKTIKPFIVMVIGAGMYLAAFFTSKWDIAREKHPGMFQPGRNWRLKAPSSEGETWEGEHDGFPVQVRFLRRLYGSATKVTFSLQHAIPLHFVLQRKAGLLYTDITDQLCGLTVVKNLTTGSLVVLGRPAGSAEKLAALWLQKGFDRWQSSVQENLGLTFALLRLEGSIIEFNFEGCLDESFSDEIAPFEDRVDQLLAGCSVWCRSIEYP
jgi:hypothetical protein